MNPLLVLWWLFELRPKPRKLETLPGPSVPRLLRTARTDAGTFTEREGMRFGFSGAGTVAFTFELAGGQKLRLLRVERGTPAKARAVMANAQWLGLFDAFLRG